MKFFEEVREQDRQFLKNVIPVGEEKYNGQNWVTLNPSFAKLILEAIADEDKKNILNSVLDMSRTTSEILEMLQLPTTSGYRKIHSLIDLGLLIVQGYTITHNRIKVNKYKSIFENLEIKMEKCKVTVRVLFVKDSKNNI